MGVVARGSSVRSLGSWRHREPIWKVWWVVWVLPPQWCRMRLVPCSLFRYLWLSWRLREGVWVVEEAVSYECLRIG